MKRSRDLLLVGLSLTTSCSSASNPHVDLASTAMCDSAMRTGIPYSLALRGRHGGAVALHTVISEDGDFRLLVEADSEVYLTGLSRGVIDDRRDFQRLSVESSHTLSYDFVARSRKGNVSVLDLPKQNLVTFDSVGTLLSRRSIPHDALIDDFVAGGDAIYAVTADAGSRQFEPVEGQIRSLDSAGYPESVMLQFPSLAIREKQRSIFQRALRRPFEHQPIARWSASLGWIVASSDSLRLTFGHATRTRSVVGGGARTLLSAELRDSGIEDYVRRTGAQGAWADSARRYARRRLFLGRSELPLIDEVIPLQSGLIAVRRLALCPDRQAWSVIDTLGAELDRFTVDKQYRILGSSVHGLIFQDEFPYRGFLREVRTIVVSRRHNS